MSTAGEGQSRRTPCSPNRADWGPAIWCVKADGLASDGQSLYCTRCRSDRAHAWCSVKRDIAQLCRDVTPPPAHGRESTHPRSTVSPPHRSVTEPGSPSRRLSHLPPSLYSDPNFPPSWPLLPDSAPAPAETYVDGTGGQALNRPAGRTGPWATSDDTELGALSSVVIDPCDVFILTLCSKFLGELGVPSLPGSFLDVLSYFGKKESGNNMYGVPVPGVTEHHGSGPPSPSNPDARPSKARAALAVPVPATNGKGKQKANGGAPGLNGVSRV